VPTITILAPQGRHGHHGGGHHHARQLHEAHKHH
jgi:hypothetical protein